MTTVKVEIDGMMCGMCEAHIKDAIRKKIKEAQKVTASASKGIAEFQLEHFMPKPMVAHELHDAIDPLGYKILSVSVIAES